MKKPMALFMSIILFTSIACAGSSKVMENTPVPDPSETSPAPTNLELPTPAPTLQPTQQNQQISYDKSQIRRMWAVEATTDLISSEPEMAIGSPDVEECGDSFHSWHDLFPQEDYSEYFLNLKYPYPLNAIEINVAIGGNSEGSMRVEVLNSSSGLGKEVYNGDVKAMGNCPYTFTLPLDGSIPVDTVIITINNQEYPLQIDAVELVGVLEGYTELPVFWRIPIPSDPISDPDHQFPGGIAVDPIDTTLFLANGTKGLYRYDVEGNLLKTYSVPNVSNLTDVAVDRFGSFVVTDNAYKWFITLQFDGFQINAGGEDFAWNYPKEVAISPFDGNIYLLDETEKVSRIRVYTSDTAEWIRDIFLESKGIDGYKGLAFDPNAILYTVDAYESIVQQIDPLSGSVIDELGYQSLAGGTSISDLAIDDSGNIYILMATSPDDSAVYVLDPSGNLIQRFGKLNYDGSEWGEGIFQLPVGIAVSGDGRFVFILENGFLTAYRIEQE